MASTLGAFGTSWYPAIVRTAHPDGVFDLDYDDGDFEPTVLVKYVRWPKSKAGLLPPPPRQMPMEVESATAEVPAVASHAGPASGKLPVSPHTALAAAAAEETALYIQGSAKPHTALPAGRSAGKAPARAPPDRAKSKAKLVQASSSASASGGRVTAGGSPTPAAAPARDAPAKVVGGKRKIVPTMVKIGSQYVKRQNLYDMDTGERSVFDSEFDHKRDSAFAPRDRPVHAPPPTAAHSSAPGQWSAPARPPSAPPARVHVPSEAEKRRVANNEALKKDIAALTARRACFFHAHRARIEHFVEPSVLVSVAEAAARAPSPPAYRALLSQPEAVTGGELRDYQLIGVDWMADAYERLGLSPILGDEMGLGKTLQTISLIAHVRFTLKQAGAALVICPLSVLPTWCAELGKWCPSLRTVKLHSTDPAERERLKARIADEVGSYDVVVTTYEMVKSAALRTVLVQKLYWRLLVLDEGHVLKNTETEISQARAHHPPPPQPSMHTAASRAAPPRTTDAAAFAVATRRRCARCTLCRPCCSPERRCKIT